MALTDIQATAIWNATLKQEGCQWTGLGERPDYRTFNGQLTKCGCPTLEGSAWCHKHYWKAYKRGTAATGKRREKAIDREIKELQWLEEMRAVDAIVPKQIG